MRSVQIDTTAFAPVGSSVQVFFNEVGWCMAEVLMHADSCMYVKLQNTNGAFELTNWQRAFFDGFIRISPN